MSQKKTRTRQAPRQEVVAALQAGYELATCQRNDGDDVAAMIRRTLRQFGVQPRLHETR
ncbi:MAG: hypothetical protein BWX88_03448 [Planctomycetes bacterium ADurb.Bin126]|nr:MAG: hypothetical protein BWX88_03448 [Planctomycetes bacterium ADurb.Bin126]HOD84368.1 hypothetical protein [Phycisphaerae bacterium]HQL76040.1 hypothetical protein [Phycisphaerae bacterium]